MNDKDDAVPETGLAEPRLTGAGRLPGDPSPRQMIERIIRVDHAGEVGAVRIYQGQRAILGKRSAVAGLLAHMEAQERHHRDVFEDLIARRRVRPTLLHPLWHVAGFALGAATALMGEKAAMACTVAVEEAIDEHYEEQASVLGDDEAELRQTVLEFQAEELEHRDAALEHGAEGAIGYAALSTAVRFGTKLAIWLSGRI